MSEVSDATIKKAMKKMDMGGAVKELYAIKSEVRAVHENQAQLIPALVSVYNVLECLAEKLGVDLPEPLIDMKLEND